MIQLFASLLPLALSPLLFRLAQRARFIILTLDGFTFVAISGLVLLEILPQSFELAGWISLPVALIGFAGPTLLERGRARLGKHAHVLALWLAMAGLLVHAFIDGIAVGPGMGEISSALPLAVIVHRLPVALMIWWLLRPRGLTLPTVTLVAMGAATVLGYGFGESAAAHHDSYWLGLFEAVVGGALLHVVAHSSRPLGVREGPGRFRWASTTGASLAFLLIVYMATSHSHTHLGPPATDHAHEHGFGEVFLGLALISAPALLLGYLAAGLVHALLPKGSVSWLARGSRWTQSARGVLFGLPLPICSCAVVPVYRSLVQQGVPLSAALALLVSAPELGLEAVLLSIPLLGPELAVARVVAAALVALLVGVIVRGAVKSPSPAIQSPVISAEEPLGDRIRKGFRIGFGEMVDHTGPWILLGIAIAAVAQPLLKGTWIGSIPALLEVPVFALLGMPMYVCASGATPLVAVLIAQGVSPGAALAFLLTGPATNVTTFGILSQLHGRAVALQFAISMALLAVLSGFAVNACIGSTPGTELAHFHEGHILQWLALMVLGGVFAVSLFRLGPRGFVSQVLRFPGSSPDDPHDDCHEDDDHGSHREACCS